MSELTKRTSEDDTSSEDDNESESNGSKKPVRVPLVRGSLGAEKPKEVVPLPPLVSLEQVLGKKGPEQVPPSPEDEDDDDEEEDEEKEKPAEQPATETDTEAQPEETAAEDAPVTASVAADTPAPPTAEESPEEIPVEPEEPEDEGTLYISREPETSGPEMAPADQSFEASAKNEAADEDDTVQPLTATSSGASTPPPPPPPAPPTTPPSGGSPNQPFQYNYNMAPPPQQNYNLNMAAPSPNYNTAPSPASIETEKRDVEKRGFRRGLIAGFITGYVVKQYVANRRHERYEKAMQGQMNQREEQIHYLQQEQQRLTRQMAAGPEGYRGKQEQLAKKQPARFERPAPRPAAETKPAEQAEEGIFDQEGNRIVLQPGWRVERSAGGYSVVLDEHNRVVYDAINYGEAFKHDQKREQLADDVFVGLPSAAPKNDNPIVPGYDFSKPIPPLPSQPARAPQPTAANQQPVDINHRLPKPRNQILATATSPWLWTAIALLLIIYFLASLT